MTRLYPAAVLTAAVALALCACQRKEATETTETTPPPAATAPAPEATPPATETTPPATTPAPMPDEAAAGATTSADTRFATMDTNGDGSISSDEHAKGADSMFKSMDANSDGFVTADEMDASRKAMGGEMGMSSADKIK